MQTGSGAVVILKAQDKEATLTNLTLSGERTEYGLRRFGVINWGTMRLSYCTVTGNRTYRQGGGVNNTKTLTMMNCTVKGNFSNTGGGGVYSRGTLLIQDSVVEDNLCYDDFGGGIANEER
jgi:predicted outer membrane repeat protein